MNWTPHYDVLGFKSERAAKNAFDYTCLKLANIEKAMNSGPSTPKGKDALAIDGHRMEDEALINPLTLCVFTLHSYTIETNRTRQIHVRNQFLDTQL